MKETGHPPCRRSSRRILAGPPSSGRGLRPALGVRFWTSCRRCLSRRLLRHHGACNRVKKQWLATESRRRSRDMRPSSLWRTRQGLALGQYESPSCCRVASSSDGCGVQNTDHLKVKLGMAGGVGVYLLLERYRPCRRVGDWFCAGGVDVVAIRTWRCSVRHFGVEHWAEQGGAGKTLWRHGPGGFTIRQFQSMGQ